MFRRPLFHCWTYKFWNVHTWVPVIWLFWKTEKNCILYAMWVSLQLLFETVFTLINIQQDTCRNTCRSSRKVSITFVLFNQSKNVLTNLLKISSSIYHENQWFSSCFILQTYRHRRGKLNTGSVRLQMCLKIFWFTRQDGRIFG